MLLFKEKRRKLLISSNILVNKPIQKVTYLLHTQISCNFDSWGTNSIFRKIFILGGSEHISSWVDDHKSKSLTWRQFFNSKSTYAKSRKYLNSRLLWRTIYPGLLYFWKASILSHAEEWIGLHQERYKEKQRKIEKLEAIA